MPPHLHPRSRTTTSLFTTTLALSFLVVGAPHILPCPANGSVMYADGEVPASIRHEQRRRRRRELEAGRGEGGALDTSSADSTEDTRTARPRECPVPKPGGLVGKILGVAPKGEQDSVSIRVETTRSMRRREDGN